MAHKMGWSGAGLGGGNARVSTQARKDLEAELRNGWEADDVGTSNKAREDGTDEAGSDEEMDGGATLESGADSRTIQSAGFKYANE